MTEPTAPMPQGLQIDVPDAVLAGTYADLVSIWHTSDAFVLDFGAYKHSTPEIRQDGDGQPISLRAVQIVQRVKVPPSQVFEIMKALEQQLTAWESETGRSPQPPAGA